MSEQKIVVSVPLKGSFVLNRLLSGNRTVGFSFRPLKGVFCFELKEIMRLQKSIPVSVPLKGSFVLNPTRKKRSTRGGRLVSVPLKGSFVLNSMTN